MIVFKILALDDWYGVSETVDIAKGKYKMPETLCEGFKQIKRYAKRSN
jgi:hypothetical protein